MRVLKRLICWWKYRALKKQLRESKAQKANRPLCEALLNVLDPELFRDYKPEDGLGIKCAAAYPNAERYAMRLKTFANFLQEEALIQPLFIDYDSKPIILDRWFVSSDNFYLNPEVSVAAFKTQALRVCALLRRSDQESYGYHEHHLRVLTKLIVDIQNLSKVLIQTSLNIK